MSHFCLLSDPGTYASHDPVLVSDPQSRSKWLDFFQEQFEVALKQASSTYGRMYTRSITAAREQFAKSIAELRQATDKLSFGDLCVIRETALRQHGLHDPFGQMKTREKVAWTELYPKVVRNNRMLQGNGRYKNLIAGIFVAGLFDPTAPEMEELTDKRDFFEELNDSPPRPWLIDDFDTLDADLSVAPPTKWSKAIVFVDNAGAEFVVGAVPLVRELALAGTKIVLAANDQPCMGVITADETAAVVEQLSVVDDDLAALIQGGMIEVVGTGQTTPLLDLSSVSDELNEAAQDAELVILEGMGKTINNINAAFKTDALMVAMLKDSRIASQLNGELCDCVCKYVVHR